MRHRHFSFSQLSQRFVHPEDAQVVIPKAIADDEQLSRLLLGAVDETRFVYDELLNALEEKLADEPNAILRMKQARQAARSILPNATESRIVVTGNYRVAAFYCSARNRVCRRGDSQRSYCMFTAAQGASTSAFR